MTAAERKAAAEKRIKKYSQELVDFARETVSYFADYEEGKYETVENMYEFARSEMHVRISVHEFLDLVDDVCLIDAAC